MRHAAPHIVLGKDALHEFVERRDIIFGLSNPVTSPGMSQPCSSCRTGAFPWSQRAIALLR